MYTRQLLKRALHYFFENEGGWEVGPGYIVSYLFSDLYNLSCTYSSVNNCNTNGTTRAKIVVGDVARPRPTI